MKAAWVVAYRSMADTGQDSRQGNKNNGMKEKVYDITPRSFTMHVFTMHIIQGIPLPHIHSHLKYLYHAIHIHAYFYSLTLPPTVQ